MFYILGAIFCILVIIWGHHQRAWQDSPDCKNCKHYKDQECNNDIFCENGEMWEPMDEEV